MNDTAQFVVAFLLIVFGFPALIVVALSVFAPVGTEDEQGFHTGPRVPSDREVQP